MAWLRFLSFIFNVIGALLLAAAVVTFVIGIAIGGAGGGGSDVAATGAFLGGMFGSVVAFANFVAALSMFFFGAVLWGVHEVVAELQLLQNGGRHLV